MLSVSMTVTMRNLRITGGHNDEPGGGIEVTAGTTLSLLDSEIVGNSAESGGGIWSEGTTNLVRTTVAGNVTTGMAPPIRGAAAGCSSRARER